MQNLSPIHKVELRMVDGSLSGQPNASGGLRDAHISTLDPSCFEITDLYHDWYVSMPESARVALAEAHHLTAVDKDVGRIPDQQVYTQFTRNCIIECIDVLLLREQDDGTDAVLTGVRQQWPFKGFCWFPGGRQVNHLASSSDAVQEHAQDILPRARQNAGSRAPLLTSMDVLRTVYRETELQPAQIEGMWPIARISYGMLHPEPEKSQRTEGYTWVVRIKKDSGDIDLSGAAAGKALWISAAMLRDPAIYATLSEPARILLTTAFNRSLQAHLYTAEDQCRGDGGGI